jgi:hypothetical protein
LDQVSLQHKSNGDPCPVLSFPACRVRIRVRVGVKVKVRVRVGVRIKAGAMVRVIATVQFSSVLFGRQVLNLRVKCGGTLASSRKSPQYIQLWFSSVLSFLTFSFKARARIKVTIRVRFQLMVRMRVRVS